MTKFLAVLKREYLTRVRTKMFIVFTILGPVMIGLFTVVPAYIASIKPSATRIAIIDLSEGGKMYERVRQSIVGGQAEAVANPTGENANASPEKAVGNTRTPRGATENSFRIEPAPLGNRS